MKRLTFLNGTLLPAKIDGRKISWPKLIEDRTKFFDCREGEIKIRDSRMDPADAQFFLDIDEITLIPVSGQFFKLRF